MARCYFHGPVFPSLHQLCVSERLAAEACPPRVQTSGGDAGSAPAPRRRVGSALQPSSGDDPPLAASSARAGAAGADSAAGGGSGGMSWANGPLPSSGRRCEYPCELLCVYSHGVCAHAGFATGWLESSRVAVLQAGADAVHGMG